MSFQLGKAVHGRIGFIDNEAVSLENFLKSQADDLLIVDDQDSMLGALVVHVLVFNPWLEGESGLKSLLSEHLREGMNQF